MLKFKENINSIIIGFIIGLVLFGLFHYIDLLSKDSYSLLENYINLHKSTYSAWLIDLLPIIFSVIALIFGANYLSKIKKLKNLLNAEYTTSKNVLIHIKEISKGNLDYNLENKEGEKNDTENILQDLQKKIKDDKEKEAKRIEEDKQRNWTNSGYAKFGEILRNNNNNIEALASNIINNLVKYLDANQGGLFLINDDDDKNKHLDLVSSYAYGRKKFSDNKIKWGSGIIGACAIDGETIFITNIPDNYLNITSGLGNANPRCILLVPLKINEEITGVIELATFNIFHKFEIEFIEKLAESIASTVISTKTNSKTAKLLEKSQHQSEDLLIKEEELRNSIKEFKDVQIKALMQSEDFEVFKNAVNHTMISGEYNADGSLTYANSSFIEVFGYENSSDLLGKNIISFVLEEDKEDFKELWSNLASGGAHFEGDIKLLKKDGSVIWLTATYVCKRKPNKKVKSILFLASDITDKKEKSIDYLAQIEAINLASMKIEFHPNGKIYDCNELFLDNIKYSEKEILNTSLDNIIAESKKTEFKKHWKDILEGKPYKGTILFIDKEGEEKWFQGATSTIKDYNGNIKKIIYIANDVTIQKNMELKSKEN